MSVDPIFSSGSTGAYMWCTDMHVTWRHTRYKERIKQSGPERGLSKECWLFSQSWVPSTHAGCSQQVPETLLTSSGSCIHVCTSHSKHGGQKTKESLVSFSTVWVSGIKLWASSGLAGSKCPYPLSCHSNCILIFGDRTQVISRQARIHSETLS